MSEFWIGFVIGVNFTIVLNIVFLLAMGKSTMTHKSNHDGE